MLDSPRWKPRFRVEIVEPETVYLLSEGRHYALSGALYCQLAPLLDGRHTVGQIAAKLRSRAPRPVIHAALRHLLDSGLISEGNGVPADDTAGFWSLAGVDAREAAEQLRATRVCVSALGGVTADPMVAALASLGVVAWEGALEEIGAGDLILVLTDDYRRPELGDLNASALRDGQRWMLVRPVGAALWLGPIFQPNETGCWQCLATRLTGNRDVERSIELQRGGGFCRAPSATTLPTSAAAAINLAATEVAKWIVLGDRSPNEGQDDSPDRVLPLLGGIVTVDLATLGVHRHILTRRPQCQACGWGSAPQQQIRPIELQRRIKRYTTDGGHRTVRPEETFERYDHLISPVTGIISSLERVSGAHSDVAPCFVARHQWTDAQSPDHLRWVLRSRSGGKGRSETQARASGLCEAVERYSACYNGECEIRVKSRYDELGDAAVHPSRLMEYSAAQYEARETINRETRHDYCWIPEPFDDAEEIDWTPVWSLTHRTVRYVPTAFCYFGYPFGSGRSFCLSDSNGNAAGNNLEEAILQGFMEVFEGDSAAIWWYNRVRRPAIDFASFEEPYFAELQEFYQAAGRTLWALDITDDLGVPVVVALSDAIGSTEDLTLGFGAHLDPRIALLRAVTECNQCGWVLGVFEDGTTGREGSRFELPRDFERRHLLPDPDLPMTTASTHAPRWSDDIRDDIEWCVARVAEHGMETLVLDQTHPDVGMSAVKVIVPGMRHHWPRFGPGRLYDVPVELGWLPAARQEAELTQMAIPI